jgi:hypothetical protein
MSLCSRLNNNQDNSAATANNSGNCNNNNSSSARCLNQILNSLDNLNTCDLRRLCRCVNELLNCR